MGIHTSFAPTEDAVEPHDPGPPPSHSPSSHDLLHSYTRENAFYIHLYRDQRYVLGKISPPYREDETDLMMAITYPTNPTAFVQSLYYFFLYSESLTFSWDSYGTIISSTQSYVEQQCRQLLQDLQKKMNNYLLPLSRMPFELSFPNSSYFINQQSTYFNIISTSYTNLFIHNISTPYFKISKLLNGGIVELLTTKL